MRKLFSLSCVQVFLLCIKNTRTIALDSRKCSKISMESTPFKNTVTLDKNGRVYIPFHLSMKTGVFQLSLGSDLQVPQNEDEYFFIRIQNHRIFTGGVLSAFKDEEILEKYTESNYEAGEESKGYFVRIHVRTKYTSIALYPSGNEETEPYLSFRVETSTSSITINSFIMKAHPGSFLFVDCKSKLGQRCTFSSDCQVPGSVCISSEGKTSRCRCADNYMQKGNSSCVPIEINLGDSCVDSKKCRYVNAFCRKDYLNDTNNKTCQCYSGQSVSDDGECKDAPGKIDWSRISRGYPLYEDLYPGKLPPPENMKEEIFLNEGPCDSTLELGSNSDRRVSIPYQKDGFDIKFKLNQKIDGTLKFTFTNLRERKVGSLSLSNRGPNVLKFGKVYIPISDYFDGPVSNIYLRMDNEEGKSMLGFNDGVSSFNISIKKINNFMDLPVDLGITSDYPGSIDIFCK